MKKTIFPILVFLFSTLCHFSYSQNQSKIDSLMKVLNNAKEDTSKVKTLNHITKEFLESQPSKALDFSKKAIALATKLNYKTGISKSLRYIGASYRILGQFDNAILYLERMQQIEVERKDTLGLIEAHICIGNVYGQQGNYTKTIEHFLNSLKLSEKANHKKAVLSSLVSLSSAYMYFDTIKAFEFSQKALELSKKVNDPNIKNACLNNLIRIYASRKEYGKAVQCINESIEIGRSLHNSRIVSNGLISLGSLNGEMGNYKEAIVYFHEALILKEKIGQKSEIAKTLFNLGSSYQNLNKKTDAIECFSKSLRIAEDIGDLELTNKVNLELAKLFATQNQYKNAFQYYEKYSQTKDSLLNKEKQKQIVEMQTKYETEKKEQEINTLKKDQEISSLLLAKQNIKIWVLIAGLIILVIFGFLIYNRYKLKQKSILNASLAKERERNVEMIVEATENERQRMAGDLHDGVCQTLSVVKMRLSSLDEKQSTEQVKEQVSITTKLVDAAINEARMLSHTMMPVVLTQLGLKLALEELVKKVNESSQLKIELNTQGMEERLEDTVEINIYRIIQELINNIVKHAGASKAIISLRKIDEQLFLKVTDNGVGMNTEKMNEAAGIGWKIIKSRIHILKGLLNLKTSAGSGTIIETTINIQK